jgi:hypothetical protein
VVIVKVSVVVVVSIVAGPGAMGGIAIGALAVVVVARLSQ